MPQSESNQPDSEYGEFEAALCDTEKSLTELKERYYQIRQAQQRQTEIEQSLQNIP